MQCREYRCCHSLFLSDYHEISNFRIINLAIMRFYYYARVKRVENNKRETTSRLETSRQTRIARLKKWDYSFIRYSHYALMIARRYFGAVVTYLCARCTFDELKIREMRSDVDRCANGGCSMQKGQNGRACVWRNASALYNTRARIFMRVQSIITYSTDR